MSGGGHAPRCIVCGKPIAKKTKSLVFMAPWADHKLGDIEDNGISTTYIVAEKPKTKADVQRFSNFPVVSVRRGYPDNGIGSASVWDGESYADPYFHSGDCAQRQGYASAQSGARFTWKAKP